MISLTSQAAPKPSLNIELARERIVELLDLDDLDITKHLRQGGISLVLQHPLVSTIYAENMIDYYEKLIQQNGQDVLRYFDEGKPERSLSIFANIYRLDALMAMECALPYETFWSCASDTWQMMEWPSGEDAQWREIFLSGRPAREHMMSEEERSKLASMPDMITIWRGTTAKEKQLGMSWTVDKDRAQWFSKRTAQFFGSKPKVLERQIAKTDVIAYLESRGEHEIIAIVD